MNISIDYKLTGTGWSRCDLGVHGKKCTVTASYLSDALGELVRGVNHMLAGGGEAKFCFDEEPGEYRWIFQRREKADLSIQILEFPELWGEKPDSEGKIWFDAVCKKRDFALALLSSLNQILVEHGLDGYKKKWAEAEFPVEEYKALCAHLGEPSSNKSLCGIGEKP